MTARLDNSFNRIREFTLHASHELKTPLTVMHGELETALRDEHNNPTTHERLLSQLDELVRYSFADAQILARPRTVRVELGRCEAAPLQGDRHRLRQLLLNLTDN